MDHHLSSLVVRRWEEGAGGDERMVGEVAVGRELGAERELLLTFH